MSPAGPSSTTSRPTEAGSRAVLSGPSPAQDTIRTHIRPADWLSFWSECYGPTVAAFAALDAAGQAALVGDLLDVVDRHYRASDGTMVVPAEYLEVVAIRA